MFTLEYLYVHFRRSSSCRRVYDDKLLAEIEKCERKERECWLKFPFLRRH